MTAIGGEARYGLELAQLLTSSRFRRSPSPRDPVPVLLIPGFMAGDGSLTVLRTWLRKRGHRVSMSGIRINVDCAERAVNRLQAHLNAFAADCGRPVTVIGQSRGGTLARVLAHREPASLCTLVTLGSPVVDPLAVSPAVRTALRSVAWLGDAGLPGLFSNGCRDGDCCADFRADLAASLPGSVRAVSVYSRSDGIVDWRACLDPDAELIEVQSSHCGMAVNMEVYGVLERVLAESKEHEWSG